MPNFSGIWTVTQQMQAKGQSIWPAFPGAPTIGTATRGNTTASVTFTAPANTGYPASVTYTATSSPGGVTGTGASSPITVSGLTNGTAYTFTVTATNATGTGPASAASNSVTPDLAVGDAYQGGFFAGQISTTQNGVATFNLVIGPAASAQNTSKQFKTSLSFTTGTDSVIDGPTNSALMNNGSHPAAQFCEAVTVGGYSDWYLPAYKELAVLYINLKPTTQVNFTGSGTNNYSVPRRYSNYTTGDPAQTSAAAFQSGGAEELVANYYWSSTQLQYSADRAYLIQFTGGSEGSAYKTNSFNVRAIRRVAV